MRHSNVHPLFEEILGNFQRTAAMAAPAISLRARAGVVHLINRPHSVVPACGKADVDDEFSTDPRDTTCRRCQLGIPEAA